MHVLVENIQQDIYAKYPLQLKELLTFLAYPLLHFKNGSLIVIDQPSLNIVGKDPSRTPQVLSYALPKCIILTVRNWEERAGKTAADTVIFSGITCEVSLDFEWRCPADMHSE